METQFAIFKKTNKLYWTPNVIILLLVLIMFPLLYLQSIKAISKILIVLRVIEFLITITYISSRYMFREREYEPLKGELSGKLIFKASEIVIDQDNIKLYEIKNINLFGWDFLGAKRNIIFILAYNGFRSQGVRNVLIINLADGTKRIINFRVIKDDNIENLKVLLKNYARQGIISYDDLRIALDHYHVAIERSKKNRYS